MITLRQLRYFQSVVQEGHFGRAADACAVSQPSLSVQIKELEEFLGLILIERRKRDIGLTDDGKEIAKRADAILGATRDLVDFARHRAEVLTGSLSLGVIPSIAPYVLPKILPELQARHPSLRLRIRETQTTSLVAELLGSELDVLFLALPIDHPDIETIKLFDDHFFLAVPSSLELRQRRADADLVDNNNLLLLEEGHCLRDQALDYCQSVRPSALRSFGATSLTTIIQMVASGLGVTLLPEISLPVEVGKDSGIRLLRFEAPEPKRTLGLAWRTTSPRKEDFAELGRLFTEIACDGTGSDLMLSFTDPSTDR